MGTEEVFISRKNCKSNEYTVKKLKIDAFLFIFQSCQLECLLGRFWPQGLMLDTPGLEALLMYGSGFFFPIYLIQRKTF